MATSASKQPETARTISIEAPAHLHARIEEAAAWRGVSVTNFVVEAAAKEADEVIEKERLVRLTREDSRQIMHLLENPPHANAALRKAAELHRRLIGG
jgi:uncharacterized protein (DUF1778 family)